MVAAAGVLHPRDMTSTLLPSGRRTGATWVAATGAFLLLAGAAVFVAVSWDQLSRPAKLGVVVALTAAFLAGGRALRRSLPATGDVLFHLGAFLLPVDLAAMAVYQGAGWRTLLLAEGVLGVVVLGGMGLATGSVVLRWAGVASMPVLAAGTAAVSPLPAALVLALVALAAEVAGRVSDRWRRPATAWALVAGLAPVLMAALSGLVTLGSGTSVELGLAGDVQTVAGLLTGALAAAVLARQATAARDVNLAFCAFASLAAGAGASLLAADLPLTSALVALTGAFVLVETAALLGAADPFWRGPLAGVADVAEVAAGGLAVFAGGFLLATPVLVALDALPASPTLAAALALAALGWLAADLRRYRGTPRPLGAALLRGGAWPTATVPLAVTAAAMVTFATGSGPATAAGLVAVAAALVVSGRPAGHWVAAAFAPLAVACAAGQSVAFAAVAGLAGAVVVAEAAVRGGRADGHPVEARLLAAAAVGTALLAAAVVEGSGPGAGLRGLNAEHGPVAAVTAAVSACWLLSLLLDRDRPAWPERSDRLELGDVARMGLLVPLAASVGLDPARALPGVVAVTVLYAVDAFRLRRPDVGVGAAVAVQVVVALLARANGLDGPATGLALCVGAVAWAGLAAVVDAAWRRPFVVAAGAGLALGLLGAAADPVALSSALLVAGGLGIGAGLALGRADGAHAGGVLVILGLAGHLSQAGVTASEAYLAPVAVHLLVAGHCAVRRHGASSWTAYAPAVALLGGAALAERVGGGAGWHALVAGGVGVAAVAAGGWLRLAGPLLAGTALLVAVTVHESLSALAGVPTWAWLALGGSVLLGIGVALERSDTSPTEAGRRVVDVLAERFG